ncbi:Origin of replication complex subunit 5 [Ananas comosus]|uniref:Origin of replication complex subunit 5 n=1 Tax=Ananas comosus TaxID=4615 RepID=A0A199VS32_ANACO|nr:Origin of replication complex subunit 5 [Ananas comosus]
MANEETKTLDSTPRRTTRSSSSSLSLSSPQKPSLNPPNPPPPSLPTDLLFSAQPITLDQLLSNLPGRNPQILEVLRLIGPLNSPTQPILLYGGVSTGKTSTILQVFRYLNRPFVYASCRSCYNPRILFESVLNQLLRHRRSRSSGFASSKRCERASEFVDLLRDALLRVLNELKERRGGKGGNGEMVYVIFDNVELIRSWDKSSLILCLLFRLFDILKIPELGLIYISSSTPDAYYSMTGSIGPNAVHFPEYTLNDLHGIFMRNQENPKLYSSFLRVTKRVDELATAFESLFRKYCEPLTDLKLFPDERMKRRLFDYIQPHLTASLNETFDVPVRSSSESAKDGDYTKKGSIRKTVGGNDSLAELDFHMSVSAKYLLLSAFLASRNPATLDAALFDSTGGSSSRKRKRKSSQASIDQNDHKAEEILIKGPGTFPLERLLAIFQCITSLSEEALEEEQLQEGKGIENATVGLMSDVLLQLSTLCNANFLCKSGSCPLDGSRRYRSTIDEDFALKVARSINFPLSKYIYRR